MSQICRTTPRGNGIANERENRFGYSGLPSNGSHDIGTLLDLECTWTINEHVSTTAYYGHVFGGEVLETGNSDSDIDYFFLELMLKG